MAQFSKAALTQLARVVRYVEGLMAAERSKQRVRQGRGDHGLLRYKLTEALTYRSSATATLSYQDSDDGGWHDGTSPDADAEVYDALLKSGEELASGSYVVCYRDHRSGLLNAVNSDNCAS
jgi:hypothetical protein